MEMDHLINFDFKIQDEGSSFDMKKVNGKIFGLYRKFHNNIDSKEIGLYLVQTHVSALGGQITVESQPNEGAKFLLKFED